MRACAMHALIILVVLSAVCRSYFRVDQPLRRSAAPDAGRLIETFLRVESPGAGDVHWVRVVVDPSLPEVSSSGRRSPGSNLK